MLQVLYLPGWTPTSLNKLKNSHWTVGHKIKKRDKDLVHCYNLAQELQSAQGRRKVDLRIILGKGMKQMDQDNVWKSLLDALVYCQLLHDDSPRWCKLGSVEYYRSGTDYKATYIHLEDI